MKYQLSDFDEEQISFWDSLKTCDAMRQVSYALHSLHKRLGRNTICFTFPDPENIIVSVADESLDTMNMDKKQHADIVRHVGDMIESEEIIDVRW